MEHPTLGNPPGAILTVGQIGAYADALLGQLDKANAEKRGADQIYSLCEARNARAIAAVTPHGLGWGMLHKRPKL